MKTIIMLLLAGAIMMTNSCGKKNDCKGEPESINFNETVELKLVDQNGNSIFDSTHSIDSLLVMENGEELELKFDNKDSSFSFPISINSIDYIDQFWNQTISTDIVVYFTHSELDTVKIRLSPVIYPERCDAREYVSVVVDYNNKEVKNVTNTSCITCNNPLVIIK